MRTELSQSVDNFDKLKTRNTTENFLKSSYDIGSAARLTEKSMIEQNISSFIEK